MKKDINYINIQEPSMKEARKRRGAEVLINNFILEPKYINLGAGKKYLLKTYGCQGNLADSEKIAGILEMMGYVETNDELNADFVLFNTCAIRESAEQKIFGNIGELKNIKISKPDMIIAIGGCMSQQVGYVNEIFAKYPYVDIVFGTHNLGDFENLLKKRMNQNKKKKRMKVNKRIA